jgi:hypothetical protein
LEKTDALRSRFAIRNITSLSIQHLVVSTFLTVGLQSSAIGFLCDKTRDPVSQVEAMKQAEGERSKLQGRATGPGKQKRASLQWSAVAVDPGAARSVSAA